MRMSIAVLGVLQLLFLSFAAAQSEQKKLEKEKIDEVWCKAAFARPRCRAAATGPCSTTLARCAG